MSELEKGMLVISGSIGTGIVLSAITITCIILSAKIKGWMTPKQKDKKPCQQ